MSGQQCKWDPRIRDLLTTARFYRQARKESSIDLLCLFFLPCMFLAHFSGGVSFGIGRAILRANRRLLVPFVSNPSSELEYVYRHIDLLYAMHFVPEESHENEQEKYWDAVTQLDESTENLRTRFLLGCYSGRLFHRFAQNSLPLEITVLQRSGKHLSKLKGTTPLNSDLQQVGSLLLAGVFSHAAPASRAPQLEAYGWWLGIRAVQRFLDGIVACNKVNKPEHVVMFLWHRLLRYVVCKRGLHRGLVQSLEIEPATEAGGSIVHALAKAEKEFLEVAQQNDLAPEEGSDALRKIHQVTLAPVWRDYFANHGTAKRWRQKRKQSAQ